MSKRAAIILAGFAVALSGLSVTLAWRVSRYTPAAGRVFTISEANQITLYKGSKTLVSLTKSFGKDFWRVDAPGAQIFQQRADVTALDSLLALIASLQWQAAEEKNAAAAGVAANDALQLALSDGQKTESVFFGAYAADGLKRYFAADTAPAQVLEVDGALARILERPPAEWRSRNVFALGTAAPDKIHLTDGADGVVQLQAASGGWVVTEPFVWPADLRRVGDALRFCAMLRADDVFADAAAPDLSKAAAITLTLGKKREKAYFWSDGKRAYARRENEAATYVLPQGAAGFFRQITPARFQRLTLDLLAGRQPARYELTRRGKKTRRAAAGGGVAEKLSLIQENNQWRGQVGDAPPAAAENEAVAQLGQFLAAVPLVRVLPAATALGEELYRLRAADALGREMALLTVYQQPGGEYYAKVSGREPVVVLAPLAVRLAGQDFSAYRWRLVQRLSVLEIARAEFAAGARRVVYRRIAEARYAALGPTPAPLPESANWELFGALRELAFLRCAQFVPDSQIAAGRFGFANPRLTVTLQMQALASETVAPKTRTAPPTGKLTIGNAFTPPGGGGELSFAKLSTRPGEVFLLNKKQVDLLMAQLPAD